MTSAEAFQTNGVGEPFADRRLQFGVAKRTSADHPVGDQRKEALYLIQPRTAGGREMDMEAASALWLEVGCPTRANEFGQGNDIVLAAGLIRWPGDQLDLAFCRLSGSSDVR